MKILLAAILFAAPTAAFAWDVGHFKDRMTDRQETFATVQSHGTRLYVDCMNGKVDARLIFPRRIGVRHVGATYRVDNGPVVPRIAYLTQEGTVLWPFNAGIVVSLKKAKRVRVKVGPEFLDFDLAAGTGGGTLPEIRCGR